MTLCFVLNFLKLHAAMLTTTKTVLSAPLPRVFEESANGKAVPVATPAHGPIGGGFQQEELGRISKETVSPKAHIKTEWLASEK